MAPCASDQPVRGGRTAACGSADCPTRLRNLARAVRSRRTRERLLGHCRGPQKVDEGVELVVAFLAVALAGAAIVPFSGSTRRRARVHPRGLRGAAPSSWTRAATRAHGAPSTKPRGERTRADARRGCRPRAGHHRRGRGRGRERRGRRRERRIARAGWPDAGGETARRRRAARDFDPRRVSHVAFTTGALPTAGASARTSLAHYCHGKNTRMGHARLDGAPRVRAHVIR